MAQHPTIAERIAELQSSLPDTTKLIAVSKFHPAERIQEAYDAGQRIFGESRVQELAPKAQALPEDIQWHMIGTLQKNKVKYIAGYIDTIHSIDSLNLLKEVERQAERQGRSPQQPISLLLQMHIAQEETKQGMDRDELTRLLDHELISQLKYTRIVGLMGMATYTDDDAVIAAEFEQLRALFDETKQRYFATDPYFRELSIGMSGDYQIALQYGATMVRIGTAIFGEREY